MTYVEETLKAREAGVPEKPKKPDKYPPREGFVPDDSSGVCGGYLCPTARPCRCGGRPMFSQLCTDKSEVARVFIGVCQKCGRRTVAEGSLEDVLAGWNRREYTPDSEMVAHELQNPSEEAVIALCNAVIADAIVDAVELIKLHRELKVKVNDPEIDGYRREGLKQELSRVKGELRNLQIFFERSPMMFERDTESALSDIRKAVFPDLEPKERIKIPLKLVNM